MSIEELVRSWDIDDDGKISKSEAEIARARMRRQRTELQLRAGIDPLTGLPRRSAEDEPKLERAPDGQASPKIPPDDGAMEEDVAKDANTTSTSQPKLPSELLGPITTKILEPGLPRQSTLTGQPDSSTSKPPAERSSRASWLPPSRTGATGVGGPRAGAPAAVSGYGTKAWSDLNAGRYRGDQTDVQGSSPLAGRTATTGGGLLPAARRPGQTGAMILPGQTNSRLAPLTPSVPGTTRSPTVEQPRVRAEDMGGYGL